VWIDGLYTRGPFSARIIGSTVKYRGVRRFGFSQFDFLRRECLPRSGYGTKPRVAAPRGYPGNQVIENRNPNGVATVSLSEAILAYEPRSAWDSSFRNHFLKSSLEFG